MTSPSPLLYDTCYHIYNRGNNRENIFIQERNYTHFLNLHFKYIEPVAETFAYCLLRNHFHMAVKTKSEEEILAHIKTLKVSPANQYPVGQENLVNQNASQPGKPLGSGLGSDYISKQFSHFFNAYAKAINSAYGRTGSLFQHPFGRVPIASGRQFWNVIAYIHQNPQKHKFVEDFREWKYSSYGILISDKPTKIQREIVLDWFGGRQQYLDLHAEWVTEENSKWFAEDDYD
jgi:REP element-mobilizing transposase RayT